MPKDIKLAIVKITGNMACKDMIEAINTFHTAGVSRRQVMKFTKVSKCQNSGIWSLYLESP